MKLAILGATSQIAKDLIRSLSVSPGIGLSLYARRVDAVTEWLELMQLTGRYAVGNYTQFANTTARFDAVLNFVGSGNPAQTAAMGASILDITHEFDSLALEYLKRQPTCRYIFISSGAAYGGDFAHPASETTLAQFQINDLRPSDWYGLAKLYTECQHRALEHNPIVDIRVFNYFSDTADISARFLITDVLRAIRDREVFQTSADNITRDYIGPAEMHQMVTAILAAPPVNAVVDCYTKAPLDKLSMLEAMKASLGLSYELVGRPTGLAATGNKTNYYSTYQKASSLFGYAPKSSALDIVLDHSHRLLTKASS